MSGLCGSSKISCQCHVTNYKTIKLFMVSISFKCINFVVLFSRSHIYTPHNHKYRMRLRSKSDVTPVHAMIPHEGVISFTPWAIYPWRTNPHYELNNRLGEPQSQLGCFRGQKSILPLPGTESQFFCNTAHGLATILNTLPQLLSFKNIFKSGNFTKA